MTKRMLSLLLALVMTLSLCVPALAADEFEAETVTEVEEQAPEAPVEPEAPEAEVVEEPVVEEEAVEAPEAVAALVEEEEEDLPLLVKLGVVTKEAHYRLWKDVQKVEELGLEAKVKNHEVRCVSFDLNDKILADMFTNYLRDPEAYYPFKNATGDEAAKTDFLSVLGNARTLEEGIDGVEVALTVNTATVEATAAALESFLPGGKNELVDDIYTADGLRMTYLNMNQLAKLITSYWHYKYNDTPAGAKLGSTITLTLGSVWAHAYQLEYRAALEKATEAFVRLKYDDDVFGASYVDYKNAVDLALQALAMESEAWKPGDAEMAEVNNAIAGAPYNKDLYNTTRYGLGTNTTGANASTGAQTWEKFNEDTGYLGAVKALKADKTTATVEFAPGTTMWEVYEKVEALKQHDAAAGEPTLEYMDGSAAKASDKTVSLKFKVNAFKGFTATDQIVDGYQYAIAFHVKNAAGIDTWKQYGSSNKPYEEGKMPEATAFKLLIGDGLCSTWGTGTATVTLTNLESADFAATDKVIVHVYVNKNVNPAENAADAAANGDWEEIDVYSFTIGELVTATSDMPYFGYIKPQANYNCEGWFNADHWVVDAYSAKARNTNTLVGHTNNLLSPDIFGTFGEEKGVFIQIFGNNEFDAWAAHEKGYAIRMAVLDKDGKAVITKPFEMRIDSSSGHCFALSKEEDAVLKKGTYTVVIQYCPEDKVDTAVWETLTNAGSATFTIGSLGDWGSAKYVPNAKTILAAAKILDPIDYKIAYGHGSELAGTTEEAKVADAIGLIKKAVAAMEDLFKDPTAGNTMTNHNKVCQANNRMVSSVGDIILVCSYLEKKNADLKPMAELLANAEKEVGPTYQTQDEGTPKYIFTTYGKLKETMKQAEALINQGAVKALQSEVNKVAAALEADIAALEPIDEIDKAGLEEAIAAAEKLIEADYTVDTWHALEQALASAKAVVAKDNVTQAQLTNAADILNKAYNALKKNDVGTARAALQAVIDKATAEAENNHTDEFKAELSTALEAAEKAAKEATTVEALEKAQADLQAVLDKAAADTAAKDLADEKAILEAAITDAEAEAAKSHTSTFKAALDEAIAAAKKVVEEAATVEAVKEGETALAAALVGAAEDTETLATLQKALKEQIDLALAEQAPENGHSNEYLTELTVVIAAGIAAQSSTVTADIQAATRNIAALLLKAADDTAKKAAYDAAKADLAKAKEEAAAVDASKWTKESYAAVQAALTAANALPETAGTDEMVNAAKAIRDAIAKLIDKSTVPGAPASGTGWVVFDGDYYYYRDGKLVTGWIFTGSKHGLWYYTDSDGKLVTGFQQVTGTKYDGWYYFQPSNENGCIGAVLSGWQQVPGFGWGYFSTQHNGHWGACTYTDVQGDYVNYQPVK